MNGPALAAMICRELRALERELQAYKTEDQVWLVPPGLPNSGGTLALHAAGNLLHFIGAVLGGTSYVRDRDAEFSRRGVPRSELIEGLRQASEVVTATLSALDPAKLEAPYPLPVLNRRLDTGDFMMHLATHLAYHTGQVDFHRRIVTGDVAGVGAVSPTELSTARTV
jgi:DinB family protein